jgi:hypothetical protein
MDVFACLSCGRRFAVHGAGALGGWRCTNCKGELGAVSRDVSRISLLRRQPTHRDQLIMAPAPTRSAHVGFMPSSDRAHTAEHDIHSASDVDAEIAALARLARKAERL